MLIDLFRHMLDFLINLLVSGGTGWCVILIGIFLFLLRLGPELVL